MSEIQEPGGPQPEHAHAGGEQLQIPDSIAALQGLWGFGTGTDALLVAAVQPPPEEPAPPDRGVTALSEALEKYKEWTQANIAHGTPLADEQNP